MIQHYQNAERRDQTPLGSWWHHHITSQSQNTFQSYHVYCQLMLHKTSNQLQCYNRIMRWYSWSISNSTCGVIDIKTLSRDSVSIYILTGLHAPILQTGLQVLGASQGWESVGGARPASVQSWSVALTGAPFIKVIQTTKRVWIPAQLHSEKVDVRYVYLQDKQR